MKKSVCRMTCALIVLFFVGAAMPSLAVDLRCETICFPSSSCSQGCTVYGWWTTCGSEGYPCSGFTAEGVECQDSEPLLTPVPETSVNAEQSAPATVAVEPEAPRIDEIP